MRIAHIIASLFINMTYKTLEEYMSFLDKREQNRENANNSVNKTIEEMTFLCPYCWAEQNGENANNSITYYLGEGFLMGWKCNSCSAEFSLDTTKRCKDCLTYLNLGEQLQCRKCYAKAPRCWECGKLLDKQVPSKTSWFDKWFSGYDGYDDKFDTRCAECKTKRSTSDILSEIYAWAKGLNEKMDIEREKRISFEKKRLAQEEKERERQEIETKLHKAKAAEIELYRQLRKKIMAMPKYECWRQDVLKRYGRKCTICGSTENIEVDHFPKSFYEIVRKCGVTNIIEAYECVELWDVNNGAPLCKEHHDKTTSSKWHRQYNSTL